MLLLLLLVVFFCVAMAILRLAYKVRVLPASVSQVLGLKVCTSVCARQKDRQRQTLSHGRHLRVQRNRVFVFSLVIFGTLPGTCT